MNDVTAILILSRKQCTKNLTMRELEIIQICVTSFINTFLMKWAWTVALFSNACCENVQIYCWGENLEGKKWKQKSKSWIQRKKRYYVKLNKRRKSPKGEIYHPVPRVSSEIKIEIYWEKQKSFFYFFLLLNVSQIVVITLSG